MKLNVANRKVQVQGSKQPASKLTLFLLFWLRVLNALCVRGFENLGFSLLRTALKFSDSLFIARVSKVSSTQLEPAPVSKLSSRIMFQAWQTPLRLLTSRCVRTDLFTSK